MSKSLILMIGFAVGLTLFFSSCGGDDMEDLPSINIPLAFLSLMAAGDYTVRITITAADIPNQIVNEQNLAIVEGRNQTYDVSIGRILTDFSLLPNRACHFHGTRLSESIMEKIQDENFVISFRENKL